MLRKKAKNYTIRPYIINPNSMKIQFSFKNTEHWEEQRIKEYAELKIKSIEKLLSHLDDDEANLTIRSERFDKNNAYQVEMSLEIPTRNMIGKEASHTIEKAVDLSKDRLITQLRRYDEAQKNKGKKWSNLKRAIKELVESRKHKPLVMTLDQATEEVVDVDVERVKSV